MQNYVKFLRGTPTAYSNLQAKDRDTLYFISEKDADHGLLYLGDKLISGGISSKTSISDIEGILIGEGVSDGSLLVYDEPSNKWVDKPINEVLQTLVADMVGASATSDGQAGLVPAPVIGDQNKFLRGDGTWVAIADVKDFSDLQTVVNTLVGDDAEKSIKTIATETLAELLIPENAKESLDTLQEIAQWIQDHPDDASDINNRLIAVERAIFDQSKTDETTGEEIIIPGLVTVVDNIVNVLNDKTEIVKNEETGEDEEVIVPGLVTQVSNLQTIINTMTSDGGDIYEIKQAITWQDMD